MEDLIKRLESASGSDHKLNELIHEVFGLPFVMEYYTEYSTEQTRNLSYVPRYTDSIDAAMTLVDSGAGIYLNRYWMREGEAWSVKLASGLTRDNDTWVEDVATAAIALCIAALKAHLAMERARDAG